jgi:hypothetical protein
MEVASPARLYAAVAGSVLVVLGILGFFYSASFGELDHYENALGGLEVNGWLNLVYLATGSLGVLLAGVASRQYSLAVGLLYTALAIVGWGTGWLHLVLGVLGLVAAAGTPSGRSRRAVRRRRPRRSKPRAKPAGKRA